jgi:CubicO group peptidase (beta-lactamase class C family)
VTGETLFQIGSISKSFTALALMHLWDEGVLDLDRPVAEYLPWFEVQSRYPPIAAHHLLSHTAGIPANRDDVEGSLYMPWSLRFRATAWAPGERFHYSNVGYQALHFLLEKLSGADYAAYIQGLILDPLDMRHTNAAILQKSRPDQAVGYLPPFDDRPTHRSRRLVEAPFFEYGIGDGAIQSTAADMAAYARMLLNGGEGPRGRIVSEKAFEHFTTPYSERDTPSGPTGYGYGMGVMTRDGHRYLAHSGGMVGLYAYLVADLTDGVAVVMMVNGPADMSGIARYAMAVLRAAASGSDPPAVPPFEDPAVVENASDYAGEYSGHPDGSLVLEAAGDRLVLGRDGGDIVLEKRGEDAFYTPHAGFDRYTFGFGRDDGGEVVEVTHGSRWYTNNRYRGPVEFDAPAVWQAFTGRYRSHSPWFSYFEVAVVKGELVVFTGEGGESSAGATALVPLGDGGFKVGKEPTPEVLRFFDVVEGQALRAEWSGHVFYRMAW